MGYRSQAALLIYGKPDKVDLIDGMLSQKLSSPEYEEHIRPLFDEGKQVDEPNALSKSIIWLFDDVKWYDTLDILKDVVFNWVQSTQDNIPADDPDDYLCAEFVRIGEDSADVEEQYSEDAQYQLGVQRHIAFPDFVSF